MGESFKGVINARICGWCAFCMNFVFSVRPGGSPLRDLHNVIVIEIDVLLSPVVRELFLFLSGTYSIHMLGMWVVLPVINVFQFPRQKINSVVCFFCAFVFWKTKTFHR